MLGWSYIMYKLSKRNILKKNSSFQTVYRVGKSYANRMMVLYVLPQGDNSRKAGFAAGKRLGNAVVRNRVKRLMREIYRLNQHRLIDGADLVLMGRQAIIKSDYKSAATAFIDLCRKARILAK